MNSKALYIRGERVIAVQGGADIVSQSMRAMLSKYFEGNLDELYINELTTEPLTKGRILKGALHGYFEPYGKKEQRILMKRLAGVDFVFVDQSVYGIACEDIRRFDSKIRIAALFHNIERKYYAQRALRLFRIHNLFLVPAIIRAETAAVAAADLVIAVSERDARLMSRLYGRKPDLIVAAPVQDVYTGINAHRHPIHSSNDFVMLFVGSAFPPNLHGMRWFVCNVMPNVDGRLFIVGHGFEQYRHELSRKNVEVVGSVEDTIAWYQKAHCVVSPIFWGQGIKVKTAEAYMHGKIVIGTQEAFAGYDYLRAGSILAKKKADWIEALRNLNMRAMIADVSFCRQARTYYEQELSADAQYRKFSAVLDRILSGEHE